VPGLWLLPSGPIPPNSTEMLHIRFEKVLEDLRARFPLILVDSPPILPVSDARLIAPRADGVILALSAGTQKPAALRSALEKLALAGAEVLGVVLNQAGHDMDAVEAYDAYRYDERHAPVPRERAVPLR
jgi:Mrp family chromosome partitioning ATPase